MLKDTALLKKAVYVVGAVALAAGLYGFAIRMFVGERDVNYGSYVTWGLWVAMYLFFAGIATGSFMVASLDYLFRVKLFRGTGKYGLWGAMVTMPAALMSIGMDLGHYERIWRVYIHPNFGAPMAQLVWGYTIFTAVVAAALILVSRKANTLVVQVLMAVGVFLAIFLSGGVGALLGVNATRQSWHVGGLPAQFPVFSLASGIALVLVALAWFAPSDERRRQQLRVLRLAMLVLLVVKAYYLWTDFSLALYTGSEEGYEAVRLVLFGDYGWAFWILQLGLGMVVPFIVLAIRSGRGPGIADGLMGVLILVGFAVARANIIFPALAVPELEGLTTAFQGPHLGFDYVPSLIEWSVTAGIVGLATLAFLLGIDRLRLFATDSEVATQ